MGDQPDEREEPGCQSVLLVVGWIAASVIALVIVVVMFIFPAVKAARVAGRAALQRAKAPAPAPAKPPATPPVPVSKYPSITPALKRRWTFSLRTLFVVALLVGGLAGLGIREAMRRHQNQVDRQRITKELQEAWRRNDPGDSDY